VQLEEAISGRGINTSVQHLDGRNIPIIVEGAVTPDTVKLIPGEGMPNLKVGLKILKKKAIIRSAFAVYFTNYSFCMYRNDLGEI